MADDRITDEDMIDYANGSLPILRRIKVAKRLSTDPEAAAAMMAELRLRDELILAVKGQPRREDTPNRRLRLVATCTVLCLALCAAILSFAQIAPRPEMPAYLDLARYSHANSHLRLALASQIETPEADIAEITTATGIRLPRLPAEWQVFDVQVYPSPLGPSVEMAVMTHDNGLLSLFAVRLGPGATINPKAVERDDIKLAFFEIGGTGYVLVGNTAPEPLDDEALLLFETLI